MIIATASDAVFGRLLLSLAVIVVVGRAAGALLRRLGQPAVVGEILAGIALGPSLLGLVRADLPGRLFPADVVPLLKVVSEIGLVLFMFGVGLELDPKAMRASGRHAAVISLTSIVVPFVLGIGLLAPLLHGAHHIVGDHTVAFTPFALFIGVSMCGTAFAVLARILAEHDLLGTRLGTLLVACAAIDDVVAFSMLGVVVAVASAGSSLAVLLTLAELAALVGGLLFVVRPLARRYVLRPYEATGRLAPEHLALLLAGVLLAAFATHEMGLHPMMGAFLVGATLPCDERRRLAHDITGRFETVCVQLLMPVFFVVTGLGVNVGGLGGANVVPAVVILLVACIGKFVGGAGAARAMGLPTRQSLAIGTMMNTRGLAELVILNVGRSAGVLDDQMFTMLVIMAVVTTVMAGPILRVVYPERLLRAERAARAERTPASPALAAA